MKFSLLIIALFFALGLDSTSHSANFFNRFYGSGCQARWDRCLGWVQSNCAKDTGGCNGSCVFGIRGDCEVDDLQAMRNGITDQSRDNRLTAQNQRKFSVLPKKYEDLAQDRSAVKSDGSYELVEKGKLKSIKLSPTDARTMGISIDTSVSKSLNNMSPRSY